MAFHLVARYAGRHLPQRSSFPRRAPLRRKAGEGKLADAVDLMEHDAANGRTAPDAPVGLGALADDAGDMTQPVFGLAGGTAFAEDRERHAVELGLRHDDLIGQ